MAALRSSTLMAYAEALRGWKTHLDAAATKGETDLTTVRSALYALDGAWWGPRSVHDLGVAGTWLDAVGGFDEELTNAAGVLESIAVAAETTASRMVDYERVIDMGGEVPGWAAAEQDMEIDTAQLRRDSVIAANRRLGELIDQFVEEGGRHATTLDEHATNLETVADTELGALQTIDVPPSGLHWVLVEMAEQVGADPLLLGLSVPEVQAAEIRIEANGVLDGDDSGDLAALIEQYGENSPVVAIFLEGLGAALYMDLVTQLVVVNGGDADIGAAIRLGDVISHGDLLGFDASTLAAAAVNLAELSLADPMSASAGRSPGDVAGLITFVLTYAPAGTAPLVTIGLADLERAQQDAGNEYFQFTVTPVMVGDRWERACGMDFGVPAPDYYDLTGYALGLSAADPATCRAIYEDPARATYLIRDREYGDGYTAMMTSMEAATAGDDLVDPDNPPDEEAVEAVNQITTVAVAALGEREGYDPSDCSEEASVAAANIAGRHMLAIEATIPNPDFDVDPGASNDLDSVSTIEAMTPFGPVDVAKMDQNGLDALLQSGGATNTGLAQLQGHTIAYSTWEAAAVIEAVGPPPADRSSEDYDDWVAVANDAIADSMARTGAVAGLVGGEAFEDRDEDAEQEELDAQNTSAWLGSGSRSGASYLAVLTKRTVLEPYGTGVSVISPFFPNLIDGAIGGSDAQDDVIAEANAYQNFTFASVGDAYIVAANEADWFGDDYEIEDMDSFRPVIAEGGVDALPGLEIDPNTAAAAGAVEQLSPAANVEYDQNDGDNEADEADADGNRQD